MKTQTQKPCSIPVFFLACVAAAFLMFSCSVSHSQPFTSVAYTNTAVGVNFTNGQTLVMGTNFLLAEPFMATNAAPVIVSTNGVVLPDAFIEALATATGIPVAVVKVLPLRAIVWLFVLSVGLPVIARWGRKLIPDKFQTGSAGTVLKNIALEINPGLTPTPPNVAVPKTKLEVVGTGQPVQPVTLTPPTPSTPTK